MPRNMSKIIRGSKGDTYQRWEVPAVKNSRQTNEGSFSKHQKTLPTVNELEIIQKNAYQEGFDLGKKEGFVAGKAEIKAQAQSIESIARFLERPLADLDDELVDELVEMSMSIARHIIRREIKTDPGQIVAVVRDAITTLPIASRNIRVHLHAEDAALIREALGIIEDGSSITIVEDPVLTRGGCKIATDTSKLDASIEKRIAAIAKEILGGDREGDNEGT